MFHNLPDELKALPQWVVWQQELNDEGKSTKVPYSPRWGTRASSTNPNTWGTFEDALQAYNNGGWSGIGFMLTAEDPYGFIDLDDAWKKNDNGAFLHDDPQEVHDRQVKIFNAFDSYAEKSPSGAGLHIIVKTPNAPHGRKRKSIELYTDKRFMTMTGDVFRDAPIRDHSELFKILWEELGGPAQTMNVVGDIEERQTDEEVYNIAAGASNGHKFVELWTGAWQQYYHSQSEADFALVDIIAFYTQNRAQIVRMFRASALGARDKAKRDEYMKYMVNKAFDRMLPSLDIEGLLLHLREAVANGAAEGPTAPASNVAPMVAPGSASATTANEAMAAPSGNVNDIPLPPGMVGDIARFIYEAAPRPVMQIALAGALAFMSGIVGRAYNVSGTGLNNYFMLVAPTGTGKEAIQSGIMKLVDAVANGSEGAPAIRDFVGPGDIRSDAALIKWFAKAKSFVSIQGEIGLKMARMSHQNANPHDKAILGVWLDLWGKSGRTDVFNGMAYSDATKNTEPVQSPAFTLIGESVPEKLYEVLDETMVMSGLLPRFNLIAYDGARPKLNEAAAHVKPSPELVRSLKALVAHVNHINKANGNVIDVSFSNEARALLKQFDEYADDQINGANAEVTRHLWNRAHLKAMKLAAVVAVGIHPTSPVVDYHCAKWATDLVVADTVGLLSRFERGEIGLQNGANDVAQHKDVISFINKIVRMDAAEADRKYKIPQTLHVMGIIPYRSLSLGVLQRASFRNARNGATNGLKSTIQFMVDSGEIRELSTKDKEKFNTNQRCFAVNDVSIIV